MPRFKRGDIVRSVSGYYFRVVEPEVSKGRIGVERFAGAGVHYLDEWRFTIASEAALAWVRGRFPAPAAPPPALTFWLGADAAAPAAPPPAPALTFWLGAEA